MSSSRQTEALVKSLLWVKVANRQIDGNWTKIQLQSMPLRSYCQARVLVLVRSWSHLGLIIVKIGSMSSLKNISQDLPFLDKEVKGPELMLKSQCTTHPPQTTFQSSYKSSILRKRSQRTRADAKISVHHPPLTNHPPTTTNFSMQLQWPDF